MQLLFCLVSTAFAGLGGNEESIRIALQPWRQAQLGVAIARGHVEMVDLVREQHVERPICDIVRDTSERRTTEDDARALMTRTTKRKERNRHAVSMPR